MFDMHDIIEFTDHMLVGAVNQAKQRLLPRKRFTEPCYTSAIVSIFPSLMHLSMFGNVKFGGCFIHQRPIVKAQGYPHGCELGDLLVLCREKTQGNERFNAALFQLKRDNRHYPERNVMMSPIQYDLYTKWPPFSFGYTFDKNNCYDIRPRMVTPGAQYMIIEDAPYFRPVMFSTSIPINNMYFDDEASFGLYLWNFIHWDTGRPISIEAEKNEDEWSRLIWDLINHTKGVIYHQRAIQQSSDRANGDFFNFMQTAECMNYIPQSLLTEINEDFHSSSVDSNKENEDMTNQEYNGAISILFMDIQ